MRRSKRTPIAYSAGRHDIPERMTTADLKTFCEWIEALMRDHYDERRALFSGASPYFAELELRIRPDAFSKIKTMDQFMDEEFVNLE